jgi:hypothetical protein
MNVLPSYVHKDISHVRLQQVEKDCKPKINANRHFKNWGLAKGSLKKILLETQVRGYSTGIADGESIVLQTKEEVIQVNITDENLTGTSKLSLEGSRLIETDNGCYFDTVTMNLYKELLKPEIYKEAYEEIKSKPGNATGDIKNESLDGFSNEKINKIIEMMKTRKFAFKPSKRREIPKKKMEKKEL